MSQTILTGALRFIRQIYGPNTKVPRQIEDPDLPIQFVHDVSRESALGAAQGTRGGWAQVRDTMVHVAPGELFSSIDPYALFEGVNAENTDIWMMDSYCVATEAADFGEAMLVIQQQLKEPNWPVTLQQLFNRWASVTASLAATSGGNLMGIPGAGTYTRPQLIQSGGSLIQISSESIVGGTITIQVWAILYLAPKGTLPPGVS